MANARACIRPFLLLAGICYTPTLVVYAACITGWGFWNIAGVEFLLAPMFLSPVALLCALVGLLFRKTRTLAAQSAAVSASLIVLLPFVVWASSSLRSYGFLLASRRAEPVVSAIERYEKEHGAAPVSVSVLIPTHLAALPRGLPPLDIVSGTEAPKRFAGNRWVLTAQVSTGIINWDQFMYFPNGNYPEVGYGGWVERIGHWAYVHE